MLDLIPEHQRMDLTIFRNTLLSPPNPEKDKDLLKTANYKTNIQAVFWENGKPVGGSVWIDATPRSKNLPKGCIVSDDSYFRHRYKTSFSYNLNYNDLVTNLNAYTATYGVTGWNYVENGLYARGMPTEDGMTINKNTWEYHQLLYVHRKSTPNVALEHLNYSIPVFVVQGMHMLNRTIAPKPVLDGVLVFRNSQVDTVRGALSNLEVEYGFKTYKTYNNNCFGSLAPYYNILPDHAYGVAI